MRDIGETLNRMSLDELRTLARRLGLAGYSDRRKADLVSHIRTADKMVLQKHLFPTWWQTHHNHVYGVVTVVSLLLSILFFAWPTNNAQVNVAPDRRTPAVRTVEKPIAFGDYAALRPDEKSLFFQRHSGEQFVWEGFLAKTIGFDVGTQEGVPFEKPISIELKPTQSLSPQLLAGCDFGTLLQTDSGYHLAFELDKLTIGQRIRVSGQLGGAPEHPILTNASLEAVFPVGE